MSNDDKAKYSTGAIMVAIHRSAAKTKLSSGALGVVSALVHWSSWKGKNPFQNKMISVKDICRLSSVSRTTAFKLLSELEEKGYIKRLGQAAHGQPQRISISESILSASLLGHKEQDAALQLLGADEPTYNQEAVQNADHPPVRISDPPVRILYPTRPDSVPTRPDFGPTRPDFDTLKQAPSSLEEQVPPQVPANAAGLSGGLREGEEPPLAPTSAGEEPALASASGSAATTGGAGEEEQPDGCQKETTACTVSPHSPEAALARAETVVRSREPAEMAPQLRGTPHPPPADIRHCENLEGNNMPAEELAELIVAEMAPIADGNAPNAKQHKAAVAAAIRKASDHQLLPAEDIERLRERLRSSGAESAANAICSYLDQAKDEIRRRAEEQKPLLEWRHNRPKLHFGSAAFAKLKKRLQDKNLQLSNGQWQEAAEFAAGISKHNVRPPRDPLTSEHDEDSAGEKILTSAENKARAFEKAGMRGKSASEVRTGFRVH